MKSTFTILLLTMSFVFATLVVGQVTKPSPSKSSSPKKAKRTKKSKRSKVQTDQKEQGEVINDFDLEYKLDCNLKLERARGFFEKGLLEKIPVLLKGCSTDDILSTGTREDILKLLAETHLFLNQEEKAADYYEQLLKINPFYEVQRQVDHPELVHLSKQFSTTAPFSFGLKIGMQRTTVNSKKQFFSTSIASDSIESFSGKWDILGGAFVTYQPKEGGLSFSLEALYSKFTYDYSGIMTSLSGGTVRLVFLEETQYWQTPLSVKYIFEIANNIKPYAYLGIAPIFTTKARLGDLKTSITDNNGNTSQAQITNIYISKKEDIPLRNAVAFSALAGIGTQIDLTRFYLFADLRYTKMLSNAVDKDNRFDNNKLTDEFLHVDNDLGFDSFAITVGFGYSIFRTIRVKR